MKDIVIASSNKNKIREFKEMLEPHGYHVLSLSDLDYKIDIEENGTTFKENAIIKAKTISEEYHIMAIADDSGIEIEALDNKPGINSARWLGHDTPYDIKNEKVLELMKDKTNRNCRYVCAIAICEEGKEPIVFEEDVKGLINDKQVGDKGFGYDPIVYYEPLKKTMAEMSDEEKNSISHRGKAVRKLEAWLNNEKNS